MTKEKRKDYILRRETVQNYRSKYDIICSISALLFEPLYVCRIPLFITTKITYDEVDIDGKQWNLCTRQSEERLLEHLRLSPYLQKPKTAQK